MPAAASPLVTERQARVKWDYFEDVSGAGGSCRMCQTTMEPGVPHACAKLDYDSPPVPVAVRGETFERVDRLRAFHAACAAGDDAEVSRLREALHAE